MARGASQVIRQQFFDNSGRPLAGGRLHVFEAGSRTIRATAFTDNDSSQDNQHTNPIILDSSGRTPSPVFLESGKPFMFVMADAQGRELWSQDNVQAVGSDEPDVEVVNTVQILSTAANALRAEGGVQVAGRQTIKTDGRLGDDSVGELAIRSGAVTTSRLADDAVTAEKIAAGAIPDALTPGSVEAEHLADEAVTERAMGPLAVDTEHIVGRAVENPQIGLQAVNAENIKDRNVTEVKIAHGPFAPIGSVVMWPGSTLPENWRWCDGGPLRVTEFPELFAVIGQSYNTVGVSNFFRLPNLRRRFPFGWNYPGGGGLEERGDTGGSRTHTLTTAELPAHTHNIGLRETLPGTSQVNVNAWDRTPQPRGTEDADTGSTGGGQAHENMPPWLGIGFIIRIR